MPPAKIDPLTSGDRLEARIGQVWFWEGYFSRIGIDLVNYYGRELTQVTDLDLLAIGFGPGLESYRTIGEAKSGTGKSVPKPLDRIVWLRGLQELVNAGRAELTVAAAISPRVRDLGRQSRVTVQSMKDLAVREETANVAAVADLGAQGPTALILRRTVKGICGDDPALAPAFKFLTSTVWFLDPFAALKQCLGLLQTLTVRWTPAVKDDEQLAVRWLISEALSVWMLNLVAVVGHIRPMDPASFTSYMRERLADGVVPAQRLRVLARDFDKFIGGLLAAAKAPPELRAEAVGAFEPTPPEWADSIAELALRLSRAQFLGDLPRQFDVMVHERLARGKSVSELATQRLRLDDRSLQSSVSLAAAFLRNYGALTDDLSNLIVDGTVPGAARRTDTPAALAGAAADTPLTETAAASRSPRGTLPGLDDRPARSY